MPIIYAMHDLEAWKERHAKVSKRRGKKLLTDKVADIQIPLRPCGQIVTLLALHTVTATSANKIF
jgi:hypothetical protein